MPPYGSVEKAADAAAAAAAAAALALLAGDTPPPTGPSDAPDSDAPSINASRECVDDSGADVQREPAEKELVPRTPAPTTLSSSPSPSNSPSDRGRSFSTAAEAAMAAAATCDACSSTFFNSPDPALWRCMDMRCCLSDALRPKARPMHAVHE